MTADNSSAERTRLHPARLPRARFHRSRGQHRDPSRTALARWGRGRGPAAGTTAGVGTGAGTGANTGAGGATRPALLTVAQPSAASLGVFAAAAAAVPTRTAPRPALPPAPTGVPGVPAPAHAQAPAPAVATGTAVPGPSAPEEQGPQEQRAQQQRVQEPSTQAEGVEEEGVRGQRTAEAARPRYCLPVAAHGIGAGFGQDGAHWAVRHTGIDFPVATGTAVHAVTDGTVATGWTPAHGYLAIVRAPDGTETWYAHLSGYRVQPGPVRAGDVIGTSGATGNATGPHLHVEVRPAGGGPVDPLPWLLAHGLDPR